MTKFVNKVAVVCMLLCIVNLSFSQVATFTTTNGKKLTAILLGMSNDTLTINTDISGKSVIKKLIVKSKFKKILLSNGEYFDMSKSNWKPKNQNWLEDQWESIGVSDSSKNYNAQKIAVAVIEFEARGAVQQSDVASLSDRFTEKLIATGSFRVMERNEINLILKEQGFQQTGACSDNGCLVEIGQLIAVQKIISGTVGKVGGIYTVSLRLLDVTTGAIDKSISEDCDCTIEELLTKKMERLARKLVGFELKAERSIIAVKRGDASLFVKSDPAGARIFLDGKLMDGVTPVSIDNILSGKHTIKVSKGEMEITKKIQLEANKVGKISVKLKSKSTVLKVSTAPSEVEVYLNSEPNYKTMPDKISPAIFKNIQPNSYTVSLFKQGYMDTTLNVSIQPNDQISISVNLVKCDDKTKTEQIFMLKKRRKWRVGIKLDVIGATFSLAAVPLLLLSHKDQKDADAAQYIMENSIIKGDNWDSANSEYSKKSNSAKVKKELGYTSLAMGVVTLGLGIILNF